MGQRHHAHRAQASSAWISGTRQWQRFVENAVMMLLRLVLFILLCHYNERYHPGGNKHSFRRYLLRYCYMLDCSAMNNKQDGQNSYSLRNHSLFLGPLRPFWEDRQDQGYLYNIAKGGWLPLMHICSMIKASDMMGITSGTWHKPKQGPRCGSVLFTPTCTSVKNKQTNLNKTKKKCQFHL